MFPAHDLNRTLEKNCRFVFWKFVKKCCELDLCKLLQIQELLGQYNWVFQTFEGLLKCIDCCLTFGVGRHFNPRSFNPQNFQVKTYRTLWISKFPNLDIELLSNVLKVGWTTNQKWKSRFSIMIRWTNWYKMSLMILIEKSCFGLLICASFIIWVVDQMQIDQFGCLLS